MLDLAALFERDPGLKVVLKEFPVLGAGSAEAARVAIAARMQDPSGQEYFAFRQKLLGRNRPTGAEEALAVARELGLDLERLENDLGSEEIRATLNEDVTLARPLGIEGTPSYVVANSVASGAVGAEALMREISAARAAAGERK